MTSANGTASQLANDAEASLARARASEAAGDYRDADWAAGQAADQADRAHEAAARENTPGARDAARRAKTAAAEAAELTGTCDDE